MFFSQSGWYDGAFVHSAIKRHLTLKNPENRLILGPWPHGGRFTSSPFNPGRTRFDHRAELFKFFDHYLKGQNTGPAWDKRVLYFTLGEEKWKAADAWPPQARMVSYYLASEGALSPEPPDLGAGGEDQYLVDQTHGTGHASRWDTLIGGGPVEYPDRAAQDKKLLVYDSGPLAEDTEVTGHPLVNLWVSSTADDGAFFVYLEDVGPGGEVTYVTEGLLRALHRKVSDREPPYVSPAPYHSYKIEDAYPLVPHEPAQLIFDLLPVSYLFKKGHRIRVAVAGADRDHFVLIPKDPPTITLYRRPWHASRVILPVIEPAE